MLDCRMVDPRNTSKAQCDQQAQEESADLNDRDKVRLASLEFLRKQAQHSQPGRASGRL